MDVLGSWFSFDGRIGRGRYWFVGAVQVLMFAAVAVMIFTGGTGGLFVGLAVAAVGAWMGVSATVRRWHDRGKSGWWVLIAGIPLVGPLWVLAELGFLAGENDANRFGPPPGSGRLGRRSGGPDGPPPDFDGIVARWKASHGPPAGSPVHRLAPPVARPQPATRPGAAPGFGRRGLT